MTKSKELYEHLEVLGRALEGKPAEASLDYLVDALLREAVGRPAVGTASAIGRWQGIYRPRPSAERGT